MKTMIKRLCMLLLACIIALGAAAQNKKKEREAKKMAEVKALVDSDNYVFHADFANPMRGGNISLTSEYDLRVSKDTLIAYLPYYGRAYQAPIDPMDGGIHFTSTHFTYNKSGGTDKGWEIYIKPNEAKGVEKIFLSISVDGYATLRITNTNRDPISYQGYIAARPKKK